jgi:hypothetical protein
MSEINKPLYDGPEPDEKYKIYEEPTVNLGDALSFVAKEEGWIGKLLTLLGLGTLSTAGTAVPLVVGLLPALPPELMAELAQLYPFFADRTFNYSPAYAFLGVAAIIGLTAGAVQLGYYIDVVRRVREDAAVKLPPWDDFGRLLADGGKMMVAYFVYILSTLLLFALGLVLFGAMTIGGQALLAGVVFLCVVMPLVLAYALTIIFLTSICVVPYSASGSLRDFFRFGWAWGQVRGQTKLTVTWFSLGVAANLGFQAVQSIPVVGILGLILSLAMQAPIQGHLLGQYAAALDQITERKRKQLAGEL